MDRVWRSAGEKVGADISYRERNPERAKVSGRIIGRGGSQ